MKKTFSAIAIASLALAGVISAAAYGQDDDVRSRGLVVKFQARKIDGVQISILKKQGDTQVAVDPSTNFRSGDEIWVQFTSNFDGYVYIVNVKPDGGKRVLFPYRDAADKETSNMIRGGKEYILPKGDSFAFNDETGTEILQVIMSRDAIPFLDAAVNNPNGDLGNSASSAAAELQGKASKQGYESGKASAGGGIVTEDIAIVVPENGADGIKTRDIRRVSIAQISTSSTRPAKGRHRADKRGTVVAIPDDQGKSGKLKPGDVAVFEVRLRHV